MADRKVGAVLKSIVFLFFSCVYSSIFTNRVSLHILRLKNEPMFLFLLAKESDGALQAPPVLSGMKPRRPGDLARFIGAYKSQSRNWCRLHEEARRTELEGPRRQDRVLIGERISYQLRSLKQHCNSPVDPRHRKPHDRFLWGPDHGHMGSAHTHC